MFHFVNLKAQWTEWSNSEPPPVIILFIIIIYSNTLCISQFQQCPSPPPPRADPRELGFFENKLAHAPPSGQNSCSNAPGWWLKHVKNVLFSFVSRLTLSKI